MALAVLAAIDVNQTPSSCHIGVRIKRKTIGNTRVPKKEVSRERIGSSSAVKYDEKHISTHPVRYETENNSMPAILIARSSIFSGSIKRGAIYLPANIMKSIDKTDKNTALTIMRLNIALTFSIIPAP